MALHHCAFEDGYQVTKANSTSLEREFIGDQESI